MNRISILLILISLSIFSCKKDSVIDPPVNPDPDTTSLDTTLVRFNLELKAGTNDYSMFQTLTLDNGQRYRLENCLFYLSEIELIKPDNSSEKMSEVIFVNLENDEIIFDFPNIPEGAYSGIRFNLGLTNYQNNNTDPTTLNSDNPLSLTPSMWWGWASKYKFVTIEGKADTLGTGQINHGLLYHTGDDSLLRSVTLNGSIDVTKDNSTTINMNLDVQKIFAFNTSTEFDFRTENYTETAGNFYSIAERITDNMSNAFSLE